MPRALRALLTLVVAGVLGVAGAGAAAASATGYAAIAPFTYVDADGATKSVPRGCMLVHSIIGTGSDLTQQTANVDCAGFAAMRNGLFCDAQVVFAFKFADGTYREDEDQVAGCRTLGIRLKNSEISNELVPPGQACAILYVADDVRAQSCHVIGD